MLDRTILLEGDFRVPGAECEYLCNPTCHPGRIGDPNRRGCLSPRHPYHNKLGFCPLVDCEGKLDQCEIPMLAATWFA